MTPDQGSKWEPSRFTLLASWPTKLASQSSAMTMSLSPTGQLPAAPQCPRAACHLLSPAFAPSLICPCYPLQPQQVFILGQALRTVMNKTDMRLHGLSQAGKECRESPRGARVGNTDGNTQVPRSFRTRRDPVWEWVRISQVCEGRSLFSLS